jgi:hypothetical protein
MSGSSNIVEMLDKHSHLLLFGIYFSQAAQYNF